MARRFQKGPKCASNFSLKSMNISRITKAVAEMRCDQKFGEAEAIRKIDIDLFLPTELCETTRQMVQTATALVLRCFKGQIRIHSSAPDSLMRLTLESEAQKVGVPERLDFSPGETGPWRLALGCQAEGAICADASGWTARINGVFTQRTPAAPPATAFAVACAVAKLFNRAIFRVDEDSLEAWDFCLLRFISTEHVPVSVEQKVNLGRIGLLGAGAIGSAVGYVLSFSKWSGELHVIDFDYFEDPNLETCISADIKSVNRPLRKAVALAKSVNGHGIIASERNCEVKAGEPMLKERWDSFICAVDNPETRRILDQVNTQILINAGLGATKQDAGWVLWTRHGNGDPTLSSFYEEVPVGNEGHPSEVPEEFREECSRRNYNGVSLALPFISLAAGSLLAATLYQHATSATTKYTWMQIDLLAKQRKMTLW
jgi:hypothetical protein